MTHSVGKISFCSGRRRSRRFHGKHYQSISPLFIGNDAGCARRLRCRCPRTPRKAVDNNIKRSGRVGEDVAPTEEVCPAFRFRTLLHPPHSSEPKFEPPMLPSRPLCKYSAQHLQFVCVRGRGHISVDRSPRLLCRVRFCVHFVPSSVN